MIQVGAKQLPAEMHERASLFIRFPSSWHGSYGAGKVANGQAADHCSKRGRLHAGPARRAATPIDGLPNSGCTRGEGAFDAFLALA